MSKLSHIDENNRPSMVDVGDKTATDREARARSIVVLPAAVLAALDGDEISTK
jgi:cyclic pyranopterin phosphate synthase